MADREKLADDLERAFPSPHLLDHSGLLHTADALLAAGWRHLPIDGPEFDAMVERAMSIISGYPRRATVEAILRAALTGDPAHG